MNEEQQVKGSLILLKQMGEEPDTVLSTLGTTGDAVIMELRALEKQAATVQSDADLLRLAEAVHLLVESQPGLRTLFLPDKESQTLKVTEADYNNASKQNLYAQTYAPVMHNKIFEVRKQLEGVFHKVVQPEHSQIKGKDHDSPSQ